MKQKLSFEVESMISKATSGIVKQYLALDPEKRQELEQNGVNLATLLSDQMKPLMEQARISSVLIIAEQGVGNMVLLTPALRNLRKSFPLLHITVLCQEAAAQVIRGWNCVDKVITQFDNTYYDLCFSTIWSASTIRQIGTLLNHYCKYNITGHPKTHHEAVQNMAVNDFLESYGQLSDPHCEQSEGVELQELIDLMIKKDLYVEDVEALGVVDKPGFKKYIVFGDNALRLEGTTRWGVKKWPHYTELAKQGHKRREGGNQGIR